MEEYLGLFPDKIRKPEPVLRQPVKPRTESLKSPKEPVRREKKKAPSAQLAKKAIDKAASSPYSDVNTAFAALTEEERKIVLCLRSGQRLADDVVAETGLTAGKALSLLTMLELKGILRRLPGKRIELIRK